MKSEENTDQVFLFMLAVLLPIWFFVCLDLWLSIRGPDVAARLMYQSLQVPISKVK